LEWKWFVGAGRKLGPTLDDTKESFKERARRRKICEKGVEFSRRGTLGKILASPGEAGNTSSGVLTIAGHELTGQR